MEEHCILETPGRTTWWTAKARMKWQGGCGGGQQEDSGGIEEWPWVEKNVEELLSMPRFYKACSTM